MMTLTITHKIHLTKEQRYALHKGEDVSVIGVSLPVWLLGTKTTEPAKELFCKYVIKNTRKETPIRIIEGGYEITIPAKDLDNTEVISNEAWREMSEKDKEAFYARKGVQASSLNLLDFKDGGSECLIYREQSKIVHRGASLNVVHFIDIEDIQQLLGSIPEFIPVDNLEDSTKSSS